MTKSAYFAVFVLGCSPHSREGNWFGGRMHRDTLLDQSKLEPAKNDKVWLLKSVEEGLRCCRCLNWVAS